MQKIIVATALALMSAMPVYAQSGAVEGLGAQPCSKLVDVQRTKDTSGYVAFGAWIGGFLTAGNIYEDDTYDLTPWQPLEMSVGQVMQFCKANPDRPVVHGVSAYMQFLKAGRLRSESPILTLEHDGNKMQQYEAVTDQVRDKLRAEGYLKSLSGAWDNEAIQAMLSYQRDKGMTPTGLPDLPTMLKMFVQG